MTVRVMPDRDLQLKHLNPDHYHEIFGEQVSVRRSEPDLTDTDYWIGGFLVGMPVFTSDYSGFIEGFAVEDGKPTAFARVNGRLYHVSVLKHV